ncbi:MAG: GNAT family N-acetyltransferase [Clostridia bacterium]|nr:GNAT family N-acetyltransferase [Clostridia bacterium]
MRMQIKTLAVEDFPRCAELWDLKKQRTLAERFYSELQSGNRVTYVCEDEGALLGEISLVFKMEESDYTIAGKRAYVSHLVVKKEHRRKGIGKALVEYVIEQAKQMGLRELTIGVDLDNFAALRLYTKAGFDRVLLIDEDRQGRYVKLMKTL